MSPPNRERQSKKIKCVQEGATEDQLRPNQMKRRNIKAEASSAKTSATPGSATRRKKRSEDPTTASPKSE
jgi:hypothetical protein